MKALTMHDRDEAAAVLEETGGALTDSVTSGGAQPAPLGARFADRAADVRRLELREERLAIDKERMQSGEARVGKRVVSEQQSIDIPVFHEELYVERRPVAGNAATVSTVPIGEDEDIRVPLMKERVDVTKSTVVREEVTIGKRRVEGTERVGDTLKREELVVDDGPVLER